MKTSLLLLLLSLSPLALAKGDAVNGVFRIDSSQSLVTHTGEVTELSGIVQLENEFTASRFVLDTGTGVFTSENVAGNPNGFEVTGQYTSEGAPRTLKLQGKYIKLPTKGMLDKIIVKLESDTCDVAIVAVRPSLSATSMFNDVREIVR